jgi:hypothetical protein
METDEEVALSPKRSTIGLVRTARGLTRPAISLLPGWLPARIEYSLSIHHTRKRHSPIGPANRYAVRARAQNGATNNRAGPSRFALNHEYTESPRNDSASYRCKQRFHSMIGVLGITAPFCLLACRRLFSSGPVNSAPPSPRSLGTILWDFQFTRRSTRSTSLLTG